MLTAILDELVTANRILANEDVVDSFGHVSIRHPEQPDIYIMSRARAPECIEVEDLIQFTLDGEPINAKGRDVYTERFIHGAIYERRPDITAVVHNHSPSVIPFSVTGSQLRPLLHMSASMGIDVPIWDSRDNFGDTTLLVSNIAMGIDLAESLGNKRAALMRGHGSVIIGQSLREVVFSSIYMEVNANLQIKAKSLNNDITFLSDGEVEAILKRRGSYTFERAWESWCRRADRVYNPPPSEYSTD